MLAYVIAALFSVSLPRTIAYFTVPYDENLPGYLKLSQAADWIEDKGPPRSEPDITILSWSSNSFFAWDHPSLTVEAATYLETDLGACRLTSDRSLISKADVVWFSFEDPHMDLDRWLVPRPHGALWAYYSLEPSAHQSRYNQRELKLLNGSINIMATYQSASDFTLARQYGFFTLRATELPEPQVPDWFKKSKFMVAMNSNSKTSLWRNEKILVCLPTMIIRC
jgi:hypothetical protein